MELWLLVPSQKADTLEVLTRIHVERIADQEFSLCGPFDPSNAPTYACVSYVWGLERTPFTIDATKRMSTRTMPSFAAAVAACLNDEDHPEWREDLSFWVDIFCIPFDNPQRNSTLASMGFIFAKALLVIVCLGPKSERAVQQMRHSDRVDEEALVSLEDEPWIQSVWTYQEVVNSGKLLVVCQVSLSNISEETSAIDDSHFFNCIGTSISQYKKSTGVSSSELRRALPSLDAFEDLIGDWMMAGYEQRSVLQVISNLDRRKQDSPRNTLFSTMGAVTQQVYNRDMADSIESIATALMNMCQEKADFSFLYTANRRRADSCYPVAEVLHSLVPRHNWGERQRGHIDGEDLVLDDVILLNVDQELASPAMEFMSNWLEDAQLSSSEDKENIPASSLVSLALASLRAIGYTGSDAMLMCPQGFFFLQDPLENVAKVVSRVFVSGELSWRFGKPGMAEVSGTRRYVPGVLIGSVAGLPRETISIKSKIRSYL